MCKCIVVNTDASVTAHVCANVDSRQFFSSRAEREEVCGSDPHQGRRRKEAVHNGSVSQTCGIITTQNTRAHCSKYIQTRLVNIESALMKQLFVASRYIYIPSRCGRFATAVCEMDCYNNIHVSLQCSTPLFAQPMVSPPHTLGTPFTQLRQVVPEQGWER